MFVLLGWAAEANFSTFSSLVYPPCCDAHFSRCWFFTFVLKNEFLITLWRYFVESSQPCMFSAFCHSSVASSSDFHFFPISLSLFLQASEVQMHESQSDPAGHTIQAIHIESRNPSENESRVKSSQTSPPEVAGVSCPHWRSFSPSELALQITTRDASIRPTPIQIIFICWFTSWCILSFDTFALGK